MENSYRVSGVVEAEVAPLEERLELPRELNQRRKPAAHSCDLVPAIARNDRRGSNRELESPAALML